MKTKLLTIRGVHNVRRFLQVAVIPELVADNLISKNVKEDKIELIYKVRNTEEIEMLEKVESDWA